MRGLSYLHFAFLTLCITAFGTAWAEEAKTELPNAYTNIVDADFVAEHAKVPKRDDVLIVDSRPARKYSKGHIVPAINISNSQFEKSTDLLPKDKDTLIIFYCGGLECSLSHKSAFKAEDLGYTNIRVYAAGFPDWKKAGHITGVDENYVKKATDKGAVVVDARPSRKFDKGHVPGAINISDREFEDKIGMLPSDKSAEIIYYCGGYECNLSFKSATKAREQGYTNVKLFQAGYPAWKAAFGAAQADFAAVEPAGSPKVQTGEEEGIITIASFNDLIANHNDQFHWYDVRDVEEVEAFGTYAKATQMAVDEIEDRMDELPSDKPIVFFCSTGARSGEAYDLVKMSREDLEVYFLDAKVQFHKDGSMPTASPAE